MIESCVGGTQEAASKRHPDPSRCKTASLTPPQCTQTSQDVHCGAQVWRVEDGRGSGRHHHQHQHQGDPRHLGGLGYVLKIHHSSNYCPYHAFSLAPRCVILSLWMFFLVCICRFWRYKTRGEVIKDNSAAVCQAGHWGAL